MPAIVFFFFPFFSSSHFGLRTVSKKKKKLNDILQDMQARYNYY